MTKGVCPDIRQLPHFITFPPYIAKDRMLERRALLFCAVLQGFQSMQEWAAGNQRTAASGTYISKATSSNFGNKAPKAASADTGLKGSDDFLTRVLRKVRDFIANINFELVELQDLLLGIATGALAPRSWEQPLISSGSVVYRFKDGCRLLTVRCRLSVGPGQQAEACPSEVRFRV